MENLNLEPTILNVTEKRGLISSVVDVDFNGYQYHVNFDVNWEGEVTNVKWTQADRLHGDCSCPIDKENIDLFYTSIQDFMNAYGNSNYKSVDEYTDYVDYESAIWI